MYLELTVIMEVNEVESIRDKIEEKRETLRKLESEEKPSLSKEGVMLKLMNQAIKDLEAQLASANKHIASQEDKIGQFYID